MPLKRTIYLYCVALLVCLLPCSEGLWAQESAPTDTTVVKQPEAYSLVELSDATEAIREEISLAQSRMAEESIIENIDSLYSNFLINLEEEKTEYENFRQVVPNRQKIDNMIFNWSGYSGRLTLWQRTLNRFHSRNTIALESLEFNLLSWDLTASATATENIPATVSASISKTINELQGAITDIKNQNNRILSNETEIVEKKGEIAQLIYELEDWINSGELNIFYRRHLPIWKTIFKRQEYVTADIGVNSFEKKIKLIPKYFSSNKGDFNVYALSLLIIIALILYLRMRLKGLEVSDNMRGVQRMKEIITRNVLATLTFLILLALALFLSTMPELLGQVLVIGLLWSAMVFLGPFLYREFKWVIGFVILAYVLEALKSYFWFASGTYRLYMYAESLFGLAVIAYYVMLRRRVRMLDMGPLGTTLYKVIPILILIYVVSILANTLGYTNFADLMIKVNTVGAVITVVTYGIIVVLEGILEAAIVLFFQKKENYQLSDRLKLQKRAHNFASIVAVFFWIFTFLLAADLYRPVTKSWKLWLSDTRTVGDMSITPGNILAFFGVLIVTFLIVRFIKTIVQGGIMDPLKLSRGVPNAVSLVIRYFVIVFGVVLSFGALGVDLTGFSLMAGALGVGIGFGLQNIISNFVAGVILTFERPILPGDTVQVGTVLGIVQKIGVRSSIVRSFEGADVAVPNNSLLANDLINWTQSDTKKRIEIKIGVDYDSDPNKVLAILKEMAVGYKYTQLEPEPLPLFDGFGASSLDFRLLFWVPVEFALSSRSDVSVQIYNRFKEEGIKIPFPQSDVNIIQRNPDITEDNK